MSGLGGGGRSEVADGCDPFALNDCDAFALNDCDPFALSGEEEAEVEACWLEARRKSDDQRSWLL